MGVSKPIPYLRWWIGGLLFAMTVINYIDRQTINVLAPILKGENRWTNSQFALLLISFRVAYTIMQSVNGRLLDRFGTRLGLTVSVTFYSLVQMLTSTVKGLGSFCSFRFLLACGEAANNPGSTKAVSEWFPARERAWAVALFDSGSAIGAAVAPFLVLRIYRHFHDWRPVFLVTGSLGALWLLAWRIPYRPPEAHPCLSPAELEHIQLGRSTERLGEPTLPTVKWPRLLTYRQTWGILLGRFLIDPYWFFVGDWFALYLDSKGFNLEKSMLGFWAPFLAADVGNFFGGGLSSYWIKRGWPVGRARRAVLLIFGPSMLVLVAAAFTSNYALLLALFAYATFAYAACSTMFLSLPADVFHTRAVGSVSGLCGTAAGVGTLITTYLIGQITDRFSFQPVVIAASVMPCVATMLFVTLVRTRPSGRQADPDRLLLQF
ncbi:MAG: MFS transporter [Verrucomicrobia bacterium]|nr:MAG: MFS transporter [Verrucomicrobiota bacterium]